MKLALRTVPDLVLRITAVPVEMPSETTIMRLAADMRDTMEAEGGIGLAAPQVGVSLRVIVVRTGRNGDSLALANPVITWRGERMLSEVEGCLSIPGRLVTVLRHRRIQVEGYDIDQGVKVTINAKDTLARILQHEIDHLDGKLIIDHVRRERD